MKITTNMKRLSKVGISLLLALFITMLGKPSLVESEQLGQYTSSQLYELMFNSASNNDYVNAYVYLFAYVQQNPSQYVTDTVHRAYIDSLLVFFKGEKDKSITLLQDLKANPQQCQAKLVGTIIQPPVQSTNPGLQPPPGSVLVCTLPNYKGNCKLLSVGDHFFPQLGINDAVSSVMVGSQVKLTLYVHARLDSQYITFTLNDPDLSNNPIDSTYSWSKNASAARVQWK